MASAVSTATSSYPTNTNPVAVPPTQTIQKIKGLMAPLPATHLGRYHHDKPSNHHETMQKLYTVLIPEAVGAQFHNKALIEHDLMKGPTLDTLLSYEEWEEICKSATESISSPELPKNLWPIVEEYLGPSFHPERLEELGAFLISSAKIRPYHWLNRWPFPADQALRQEALDAEQPFDWPVTLSTRQLVGENCSESIRQLKQRLFSRSTLALISAMPNQEMTAITSSCTEALGKCLGRDPTLLEQYLLHSPEGKIFCYYLSNLLSFYLISQEKGLQEKLNVVKSYTANKLENPSYVAEALKPKFAEQDFILLTKSCDAIKQVLKNQGFLIYQWPNPKMAIALNPKTWQRDVCFVLPEPPPNRLQCVARQNNGKPVFFSLALLSRQDCPNIKNIFETFKATLKDVKRIYPKEKVGGILGIAVDQLSGADIGAPLSQFRGLTSPLPRRNRFRAQVMLTSNFKERHHPSLVIPGYIATTGRSEENKEPPASEDDKTQLPRILQGLCPKIHIAWRDSNS